MELTVSTLRRVLNNALDQLEDYNDSDVVSTKTNTYFVGMPFMGTRYGYIDLNDIEVEDSWDDEDDEDKDDSVVELESRIRRLERCTRPTARRRRF